MRTYNLKKDREYQTKLSFMNTSELLDEKESVSEMCRYVSSKSDYHSKRRIICDEFITRGLHCLAN